MPQLGIDPDEVARITAVHKERYEIVCKHGVTYAQLKSSVYFGTKQTEEFPTAGDFVLFQYNEGGDSRIIKTLPRKSFFSRSNPTPGMGEQAVAANFDYVFILTSLNHDYNLKRLERYLTLAWSSGGVPIVLLTKSDLEQDYAQKLRQTEKISAGAGVYAVSAISGEGLDLLGAYLKPRKTAVFLGSSGVGKSSLINALAGKEIMKVKEIREDDSRGRHTTTHRQLIKLDSGMMIIDTPGMRELGMWDASEGFSQSFRDVEYYLGNCKFSDCTHTGEPGCAIRQAIESGELSEQRWESYMKLKQESKYSDNKAAYMREKQEWHKSIAKWSKQMKKEGGKYQ